MLVQEIKKINIFLKQKKFVCLLQSVQWWSGAQYQWFISILGSKVIDGCHEVAPSKHLMVENTARLEIEIDSRVEDA